MSANAPVTRPFAAREGSPSAEAHAVPPAGRPGNRPEASLRLVARGLSWVGAGHVISQAAANAGAAGLSSLVAVIAALMGAGVWALVGRQILFQVLLAGFAWMWARGLLPPPGAVRRAGRRALARPHGASWFFGLALISFAALNIDFVIVGHFTDVARL